jgi:hypothetical protein
MHGGKEELAKKFADELNGMLKHDRIEVTPRSIRHLIPDIADGVDYDLSLYVKKMILLEAGKIRPPVANSSYFCLHELVLRNSKIGHLYNVFRELGTEPPY